MSGRRLPLVTNRVLADAKALQSHVGTEFERRLSKQHGASEISCKKGCANCCRHPFLITVIEGILLYRHLMATGQWTATLRQRVIEAKEFTTGLDYEVWLMSNIPCPLLTSEQECSAYAARPLHCRVTYSSGDPELCSPHSLGAGTPLIPNVDTLLQYHTELRTLMRKIDCRGTLLPLAHALTLGELIETGQIQLEDSESVYAKELLRST